MTATTLELEDIRVAKNIRAAGLAKDIPDFRLMPMIRCHRRQGITRSLLGALPEDALECVQNAWKQWAAHDYGREAV